MVGTGTRVDLVKTRMTTGNSPARPADSASRTARPVSRFSQENATPTPTVSGRQGRGRAGVEAEAQRRGDGGHEGDDEQVADGVGGGAADQDRRAGDGQGPEAVDHSAGQVVGDGDPGLGGSEADGQDEQPGQQVVDVAGGPGGAGRPPKA
jgi:hypothetical protein